MKKFILIALVGCSLGILMQALSFGEPFETAADPLDEEQGDYFGTKEEAIDSSDEGLKDDLNDNAPDDGNLDDEDEREVDDENLDEDDGVRAETVESNEAAVGR